MIVLMAGLPGTGKTTLARELAARVGGRLLSKDEIRHALFSADEIEYSSQQDDFCQQVMLGTAAHLLQRDPNRIVFLDGRPFSRRYQIDNVVQPLSCTRPGEFLNACAPMRPPSFALQNSLHWEPIPPAIVISNFIWK
jgi:hypothetical protein